MEFVFTIRRRNPPMHKPWPTHHRSYPLYNPSPSPTSIPHTNYYKKQLNQPSDTTRSNLTNVGWVGFYTCDGLRFSQLDKVVLGWKKPLTWLNLTHAHPKLWSSVPIHLKGNEKWQVLCPCCIQCIEALDES